MTTDELEKPRENWTGEAISCRVFWELLATMRTPGPIKPGRGDDKRMTSIGAHPSI
jgi:hypothetical protein